MDSLLDKRKIKVSHSLDASSDRRADANTAFVCSVVIWRYPTMQQVAQLTGHSYRVSI